MRGTILIGATTIICVLTTHITEAKDEKSAQDIAFDLATASWSSGACSPVMHIDQEAVLRWTRVMIRDLDDDTEAAKAMTKLAANLTPKISTDVAEKVGWAQFCASIWSGYGDGGSRRPGLLHKAE